MFEVTLKPYIDLSRAVESHANCELCPHVIAEDAVYAVMVLARCRQMHQSTQRRVRSVEVEWRLRRVRVVIAFLPYIEFGSSARGQPYWWGDWIELPVELSDRERLSDPKAVQETADHLGREFVDGVLRWLDEEHPDWHGTREEFAQLADLSAPA